VSRSARSSALQHLDLYRSLVSAKVRSEDTSQPRAGHRHATGKRAVA
jgi:hypothetical protein